MIYIVVLNWNGAEDTKNCINSLLNINSDYDFKIVMCDNESSDDSVEKLKKWVSLDFNGHVEPSRQITFLEYNRLTAESGGLVDDVSKLIIINTGGNLGFAGGNNVGIRYAMAKGDADYIWLLNNDTVVDKCALSELINKAKSDISIGMVGSSLCYYSSPEIMQARGGATFNPFRCKARPIEENIPFYPLSPTEESAVDAKLGYVIGASMLVTKPFLQEIGLMAEDYFLYYEELDWAMRARGKYKLALAANSRVYHKVGASAGTSVSLFSLKYLYANQIKFMKRFFPGLVWSSRLEILRDACRYLRARQYLQAKLLFRIASGLEYR